MNKKIVFTLFMVLVIMVIGYYLMKSGTIPGINTETKPKGSTKLN